MENQKYVDGQIADVPLKHVRTGFNYRRRYDPARLESLSQSIREKGLIAPVSVRVLDDGAVQLLAGGRRFKAYEMAFGPDSAIKAVIRVLSDAEATAIMIAENSEREDPSIIEDAEGASRMLGLVNGDRDEASRRLGWTRNKLDRRLAIMNASQPVRDAYIDGKINVGHVEILAAFRSEIQAVVLQRMLESDETVTVEALKKIADQSLLSLEVAIFDKGECTTCRFNTGFQQSMFENSFDGSRCTNKECYNKKTETQLEVRRDQLIETYQVVRIVRPGDNSTVTSLRADGDRGVGEEQAKACRTCGDFGACVSAVPDSLGKAYRDVCFNKTCNDEKVAANKKAVKASEQKSGENAENATTSAATKGTAEAKATASAGGATKKEKPSTASIRQAVKDYREAIWRKVFTKSVSKLPTLQSRAVLVALLANKTSDLESFAIKKAIGTQFGVDLGSDASSLATTLLSMTQEQIGAALNILPTCVTATMSIHDLVSMLKAMDVKLESYWKINETFLDILTKNEIDAICVEIGLDKACETYASLKNGSKKDFIAGMLNVKDFVYIGKIPTLMRWDS